MLKNAFKKAVGDNGMDIISSIKFVNVAQRNLTGFAGKEISDTSKELLKESAYFPVLIGMENKAEDVIIEMRKGSEVTGIGNKKTAPDDINVINPAFDMTPPELITGIITEKGLARKPYKKTLKGMKEQSA